MTASPHSPLLQRLATQHGAQFVDMANLASWLAQAHGEAVLLLAGDPVRFPEGQDVAAVLPEVARLCPGGRLHIGLVRAEAEDAVAARYGSQRWPALVWLRGGRYVATLSGMLDWEVYQQRVAEALATPPSRAPGVGIALIAADAGHGCH